MDQPISVELIGGPFDGSYRFDAANPFPEGLVFPSAFGPTAYLMSSRTAIGGGIEMSSPQTMQAMLESDEPACRGGRHFMHSYTLISRTSGNAGAVRLIFKHAEIRTSTERPAAPLSSRWIQAVAVYLQLSGH
jgi:hypothetical protein